MSLIRTLFGHRRILKSSPFVNAASYPCKRNTFLQISKRNLACPSPFLTKNSHSRPPILPHSVTPRLAVPESMPYPPYAKTGHVPPNFFDRIILHSPESIDRMKNAAQIARRSLDYACSLAQEGATTNDIDVLVHEHIIAQNAYPSPLNYAGFPKSLCSSINEVICHGIPDTRELQFGDIVSFDVSVFVGGVHGDNCATVIVGDSEDLDLDKGDDASKDIISARRLVKAAKESLEAGIQQCRPGACLTEIGEAIEKVSDEYNYNSIRAYRGHGIGEVFHCSPYVKHYRNSDRLELTPGMIFTIEPMIVEGSYECSEWPSDGWTVVTNDGGRAAQFEHTVLITSDGVEILTVP